MEDRIAREIVVSGVVQGVGYRYFTQRAARHLAITGYVRNLADGRVKVVAQGTAAQLASLVEELRHGPTAAEVDNVEVKEIPLDASLTEFRMLK